MVDLSPKRKLLLLFGFYCLSSVFGSFIVISIQQLTSDQAPKLSLSTISIFAFLIPAFIAFKLFTKERLINYWGLSNSFSKKSFFITVLIMGCCIILMNWLLEVNKVVPLFHWMKVDETAAHAKLLQYLEMDNFWQLLLNLIIFSVVPSFCEEVFFRGTMQPLWYKHFSKIWMAILFTAFIFSFLHFQFASFLPRFLAGVVLGGIFHITGSLWLSIISHIVYNGSLVMLNYADQHNMVNTVRFEHQLLNPFLIILAALFMLLLFYQLHKEAIKQQNLHGS
ncbi:MAG: CPBP family intramembrane glutamic endopeptidase [Cyclobacteriaceae bacterium]